MADGQPVDPAIVDLSVLGDGRLAARLRIVGESNARVPEVVTALAGSVPAGTRVARERLLVESDAGLREPLSSAPASAPSFTVTAEAAASA